MVSVVCGLDGRNGQISDRMSVRICKSAEINRSSLDDEWFEQRVWTVVCPRHGYADLVFLLGRHSTKVYKPLGFSNWTILCLGRQCDDWVLGDMAVRSSQKPSPGWQHTGRKHNKGESSVYISNIGDQRIL